MEQTNPSTSNLLFRTVVQGGYCIGCGACAAIQQAGIQIAMDEYGQYQARLVEDTTLPEVLSVCPFAEGSANEDEIARLCFPAAPHHSDQLGRYYAIYAGHAVEDEYRANGSSGGIASWLLARLLGAGLVDGVAHVQPRVPATSGDPLFQYAISRTVTEVRAGAKSRYYPVEMSGILAQIRQAPGRYAIVGVPCFIKAVRLLMAQDAVLAQRVCFTVALFCGHLKSARFADFLGWQLGIPPEQLQAIDFRKKLPPRAADDYGIEVATESGGQQRRQVEAMAALEGRDWGIGYFKYHACDFCDDVVGECADISIGDAWLPGYIADSGGTNIIVVRHARLLELVRQGITDDALRLEVLPPGVAAASQAGGFRHRREGLAYRLHLKDRAGNWRPQKRVEAGFQHLSRRSRRRYEIRARLAQNSHSVYRQAVCSQDLQLFFKRMEPLLKQYRATNSSLLGKTARWLPSPVVRLVKRWVGR